MSKRVRVVLIVLGILLAIMEGVCIYIDNKYDDKTNDKDVYNSTEVTSSFSDNSDSTTEYISEDSEGNLGSDDSDVSYRHPYDTDKTDNKIDVTVDYVSDIISNLMSICDEDTMRTYISTLPHTSDFVMMPLVDKETKVSIEYIGKNSLNGSDYLAIVTLRQENGISKFSVTLRFEGYKICGFGFSKF